MALCRRHLLIFNLKNLMAIAFAYGLNCTKPRIVSHLIVLFCQYAIYHFTDILPTHYFFRRKLNFKLFFNSNNELDVT